MTQTVQEQIDEARTKLVQDQAAEIEELNRVLAQAMLRIEELESQLKEPQDDRTSR